MRRDVSKVHKLARATSPARAKAQAPRKLVASAAKRSANRTQAAAEARNSWRSSVGPLALPLMKAGIITPTRTHQARARRIGCRWAKRMKGRIHAASAKMTSEKASAAGISGPSPAGVSAGGWKLTNLVKLANSVAAKLARFDECCGSVCTRRVIQ